LFSGARREIWLDAGVTHWSLSVTKFAAFDWRVLLDSLLLDRLVLHDPLAGLLVLLDRLVVFDSPVVSEPPVVLDTPCPLSLEIIPYYILRQDTVDLPSTVTDDVFMT
jgi:hypothetical protein